MPTSKAIGSANLKAAVLLVETLIEAGIDHFILSPGSRSTPLALAVARNSRAQQWVIIDERSAAFFALGQGKRRQQASALICTSGSAVANWLPAVVEAHHSATPLLLLSADRPAELHQRGANQTIEQSTLFGQQVRAAFTLPPPDECEDLTATMAPILQQVVGALLRPIPGPVHLNLPYREPLLPDDLTSIDWHPAAIPLMPQRSLSRRWLRLHEAAEKLSQGPGIILCGEAHYSEHFTQKLETLAAQLDAPILADPLSNLRWGAPLQSCIVCHYDGTLRTIGNTLKPNWVIQFGDFPLSKSVALWLNDQAPATYLNIQHQRLWSDPESLATETFHCSPETFIDAVMKQLPTPANYRKWNQAFHKADQQALAWSPEYPLSEHQLLQQLHQQLPAGAVLFSGNSMAIRDIDGWLGKRAEPLHLYANRGTSGIDGNLATLCGIRSTLDPATPMVALLGDLTLFHDLNALSLLSALEGDLLIFVINNGGGGIFSYLPPAALPEFEPLWLTPLQINFEQAATLYNIDYQQIDQPFDLQQQLSQPLQQGGIKLIEWVIDREASVAAHQHYWESLQ